jgi:RNA polymerase sigma-70 factor (ECF subfamily)
MDKHDFERLCREHRRALLAYAYTCSGDLGTAEDVVQETMLIALEKRERYFPEADFAAWLISIARNVWLRECERRKIAHRTSRFIMDNASMLFDRERYSDERWERERRALAACLEELSETDRSVIRAHFSAKKRYAGIAEAMNRTVSWVKVRMFRARAALLDCVRARLDSQEVRP